MKSVIVPAEDLRLAGILEDIMRKIPKGELTLDELDRFRQRKNPFSTSNEFNATLTDWQRVYSKHFNINLDCSGLMLPKKQKGFDRLIVVSQGLTMNQVMASMRKHFKVWCYREDLDAGVTANDRTPTSSYAIRVRDRREADEELKNLSANDLKQKNVNGITLLERLILELKYWDETGNHLDINNWTLCSGSRDSDGGVPSVGWSGDSSRLHVGWCSPGFSFGYMRSRSVVS